jgi:hypothetical protein
MTQARQKKKQFPNAMQEKFRELLQRYEIQRDKRFG